MVVYIFLTVSRHEKIETFARLWGMVLGQRDIIRYLYKFVKIYCISAI